MFIYLLIIISFSDGYKSDVVAQFDTEAQCEELAHGFRSARLPDTFTCVRVKTWPTK